MLDKLLTGALQGMMGSAQPQQQDPLLQILASLLSGQGGGLAGLIQQFQQAGLGDQAQSWVSRGQNLPLSVEQLTQVFGAERIDELAADAGLPSDVFGERLSALLPQAVDQMTPEGELPSGDVEDALAMLSRLMPR
jgi:uncharacterized protein YidB (DUF937 family)